MPAAAPGIVRWRHRPMQCGPWTVRLSALRLPSLRMILSENRTPLFGIMRVRMILSENRTPLFGIMRVRMILSENRTPLFGIMREAAFGRRCAQDSDADASRERIFLRCRRPDPGPLRHDRAAQWNRRMILCPVIVRDCAD